MLTVKEVGELIYMTLQDMPPELKRLYNEAARMDGTNIIHRRIKMLTTGKMIYTIRHDTNVLPILKYLNRREFEALGLSGGVILWVYRGMAMLIPAARIANMVRVMEDVQKNFTKKTMTTKIEFTTDDVIRLPKKIAAALLGD